MYNSQKLIMKFVTSFLLLLSLPILLISQTYHSGTISTHETWYSGGNPHIITNDLAVAENVWLSIQAGCQVRFDGNHRLTVFGRLLADGDINNHIVFTSHSDTPDKGDWKSIFFDASETGSFLNYCDISYGGDDWANIYLDSTFANVNITNCTIKWSNNAGIYIQISSSPIISDCIITENDTYGIQVNNNSAFPCNPLISGCTVSYSGSYAIKTHANNAKDIINPMTIENNYLNSIYLGSENIHTGTWTNFNVPYIIGGDITVLDAEILTIEPGNIIKFDGNNKLEINGTLIADGEQTNVITFTSNEPIPLPGDWDGIYFNNPDPGCIMNFCNVWYGGGYRANITLNESSNNVNFSQCTSAYSFRAGIHIENNSSPLISYCTFLENTDQGIYVKNVPTSQSYPIMAGCFIEDNGGYGIKTHGNNVKEMSWPIILSGNGYDDAIYLAGGNLTTGTWTNFGVPYIIGNDQTVLDSETLTITAGTTLKMDGNYMLIVEGALVANGTEENHILFTSNQTIPYPGDWRHIYFFEPDEECIFNYCDVEYGGSFRGSVYLGDSESKVNISNCNISYSEYSGIYILNNCSPLISSSTIENNLNHGISFVPYQYSISPEITNCIIRNNGGYGIKINENTNVQFGNYLEEWNDILNNSLYNLYNGNSDEIFAQYIYWGTTDSTQIANAIFDYHEDDEIGLVNFNPWTNAAHDSLFPNSPIVTELRVFLEGPFNGANMNIDLKANNFLPLNQPYNDVPWNYPGNESVASFPQENIVDWVLVELRDAPNAASANSATRIARQAGFLLYDGSVVGIDGNNMRWFVDDILENLFILIWHRNHLAIMSANAITETFGVYIYDFTTSNDQAFGTNAQKNLGNSMFGLYAGDGNADGTINASDKTTTWEFDVGKFGYLKSDYNLDAQGDNPDKNSFWHQNKGKSHQMPESD